MARVTGEVERWRRHHDVSILIAAGAGVGRCFSWHPRAKVSMMIMRPPQQGQEWASAALSPDRSRPPPWPRARREIEDRPHDRL